MRCRVRVPATAAREPREATGVFYRGTGNVPGPVYTPTGARTTDDRYPDFIPRPDETPSPNGQHAHVTYIPTSGHRNLLAPLSYPVSSPFLRRKPTVPFCFLGRRTSDSRVSFRSTHSSRTNPSFPSAAFLRLLFASSCKKLPLNLYIERRVDDDFSYRNSSRLGLQLTRFS